MASIGRPIGSIMDSIGAKEGTIGATRGLKQPQGGSIGTTGELYGP